MPNDLLELDLEQVKCVVAGYSDRLIDLEVSAIVGGYYGAYYSNSKHPKKLNSVIQKIMQGHQKKQNQARGKKKRADDPDVEQFLRREAIRLRQIK